MTTMTISPIKIFRNLLFAIKPPKPIETLNTTGIFHADKTNFLIQAFISISGFMKRAENAYFEMDLMDMMADLTTEAQLLAFGEFNICMKLEGFEDKFEALQQAMCQCFLDNPIAFFNNLHVIRHKLEDMVLSGDFFELDKYEQVELLQEVSFFLNSANFAYANQFGVWLPLVTQIPVFFFPISKSQADTLDMDMMVQWMISAADKLLEDGYKKYESLIWKEREPEGIYKVAEALRGIISLFE